MARLAGVFALALLVAAPLQAQAQTQNAELDAYVDQVITTDSQGWSWFSYVPHSAHDSSIVSTGQDGTLQVHASYSYGGGTEDSVDLLVKGDKVVCIQYSGEQCRKLYDTPSHTGEMVVAGFALVLAGAIASSIAHPSLTPEELARRSQCKTDCANLTFSSDPATDNQQRIICIRACG